MKSESKLSRLVLVSPWFLLVFLIIPILVILSIVTQIPLPLGGPKPLLFNNVCLLLLVACRFFRYISRVRSGFRYGAGYRKPESRPVAVPAAEIRERMAGSGYIVSEDGTYGEKRDRGYIGTTALYGGLLILLSVGIWDNLQQFAGVILDSVGPATKLNRVESYRRMTLGPMAGKPDSLPRMQIVSQHLPDSLYPKGATEIVLISEEGKQKRVVLVPKDPIRSGSYDIYMAKLVFEPEIIIKDKDGKVLFDAFVKLDPLVQKRGPFSFYGAFIGTGIVGGVYYQPEKSLLKVVITRDGKREVTDMTFQVDQAVTQGDYTLSCAKMGQWSEIHVVHHRHKALLWLGGIIAALGLLTRIAVRPERLWIEEDGGETRVATVGKQSEGLVGA